jgi:hypothetical protein
MAHSLQLVVKDILATPGMTRALAALKEVLSRFHGSCLAIQKLRRAQADQGVACPLSLIKPNATRWNSTFRSMKRVVQLKAFVNVLQTANPIKEEDWMDLEMAVTILQPFSEATDHCQSDHSTIVTVTCAVRWVMTAMGDLARDTSHAERAEICGRGVTGSIESRWEENFNAPLVLCCSALDPWMFKTVAENTRIRQIAKDFLLGAGIRLLQRQGEGGCPHFFCASLLSALPTPSCPSSC